MTHQSSEKTLSEVAHIVQSQLTWIGANIAFLDNIPQNNIGGLKMELALLNFSRKSGTRLSTTIDKTTEKCNEFYKKMFSTHNKCQDSVVSQV